MRLSAYNIGIIFGLDYFVVRIKVFTVNNVDWLIEESVVSTLLQNFPSQSIASTEESVSNTKHILFLTDRHYLHNKLLWIKDYAVEQCD